VIVVFNTILMILNDYKNRINKPFTRPKFQKFLEDADNFLLVFYFFEFAVKVVSCDQTIAMGFVFGQGTYLKSGANCFDFFLLLYGFFELVFTSQLQTVTWISLVRVIRVFKTIRTVKGLKKLKIVLKSLLVAFQNLTNVLGFLVIFLLVYAGVGLHMFKGTLEKR